MLCTHQGISEPSWSPRRSIRDIIVSSLTLASATLKG